MGDHPRRFLLALSRPCGRTCFGAILLMAAGVFSAEIVLRQPAVQRRLPRPSFGINRRALDLRLAEADEIVDGGGEIDVVFLGPSTVAASIDPAVFDAAYTRHTGRPVSSYNMGSAGVTFPASVVMARVMLKRYAPELLVVPVIMSELVQTEDRYYEQQLYESPFIRYHRGEPLLFGKATDSLIAVRYFLRFRQWLEHPELSASIALQERLIDRGRIRRSGSRAFRLHAGRDRSRRLQFREFGVDPERLAVVNDLAALPVEVILVVMPVHPA